MDARRGLLTAALGLGLGACSAETDIGTLLERYYDAHHARIAAFCHCFYELSGHADAETCMDGWDLTASQKGCIDGIFASKPNDPPREYSSGPAIECITGVEQDYTACIATLGCEDVDGLDDCLAARNEAILDCPRLSETDTAEFETCRLL